MRPEIGPGCSFCSPTPPLLIVNLPRPLPRLCSATARHLRTCSCPSAWIDPLEYVQGLYHHLLKIFAEMAPNARPSLTPISLPLYFTLRHLRCFLPVQPVPNSPPGVPGPPAPLADHRRGSVCVPPWGTQPGGGSLHSDTREREQL